MPTVQYTDDVPKEIPTGTKVVLIDQGGKIISGHLLLPDGSRVELPPEAVGSRK